MFRRITAVAASALVVAALAACSGPAPSPSTSTPASVQSATPTTLELTADNFASVVTAAQEKAKSFHMATSMSESGQKLTFDGDVTAGNSLADSAFSLTGDLAGQEIEMLFVDDAFYMYGGAQTKNKYLVLDLDDKSNQLSALFSTLVDGINPANESDLLKDGLVSVTKVGDGGTLDGVATTEYEVVVDPAKVSGKAGASAEPETLHYWVASDGLPRKMTTSAEGGGAEILFSKWGEPVSIKAPAKSKTITFDQLATAP